MRKLTLILASSLMFGSFAAPMAFAKGTKKTATKKETKPAPPKKAPPMGVDAKKKALTLFAGFKLGMSKDEVVGQYKKTIDTKYDDQIKGTSDITTQDRLRQQKKKDLAEITKTYEEFGAKPTGWDTSIVEDEFAHNTGESVMTVWEKDGDRNQRRFFFFHDGKLYKMFISLDLSMLPEDQQNSATFQKLMVGNYGSGDIEGNQIMWHAGDFDVRAVDKIRMLSTIGIAVEDPTEVKALVAIREANAPKKKETSTIIKAVIDTDNSQAPDVKSNGNAVDAVIQANGGTSKKKSN